MQIEQEPQPQRVTRLVIAAVLVVLVALVVTVVAVVAFSSPRISPAAATPTPAASTNAAAQPSPYRMTKLETCSTLLVLSVRASKHLLDHAHDRAAHRRATVDPDQAQTTAEALGRLWENGPSELTSPLVTIQAALLEVAREALGGLEASYKQADISAAWAAINTYGGWGATPATT